jgi:uncharacterized repeat protein (TIGR01451 family)
MRTILLALTLMSPGIAFAQATRAPAAPATAAQPAVSIKSTAFVVKQVQGANGKMETKLEAPVRVLPGAVLLFVIEYKNGGTVPATKFVINNPIPESVSYTGTEQGWAVVSVDGNKSFGPLATLTVPDGPGKTRPARPLT